MPGMIGGMNVLPQYQGNLYGLSQQQLLAQALMQRALQPQQLPATVGSGGSQNYQVAPRMSPLASVGGGVANGLLAHTLMGNTAQGLNDLGMQQWNALTGGNPAMGMGASAPAGGAASPLQSAPADQSVGNDGAAGAGGLSGQLSPQPQQQQQPQALLTPGGPMNPAGWPVQMAAMRYFADPQGYWKDQAAAVAPTDATRGALQAGIDPRLANYAALAKNSSIAMRPGGGVANMLTGGIQTMPAAAEPGFQNVQDPASGRWYAVPVQGGLAAVQQSGAAEAAGPAMYKPQTGFDAQGRPVYTTAYNIATGGGTPGAGAAPSAGRFGGYQAPGGAPVAPSLAPGANDLAEGSAKSFNDLRAQASSTPTAIDGYNRAEQALMQGITTGPGSTMGTNIIGRLNTAGIPLMKGDATGYQSLQKYLANANAQAAAASGYNGSDARFESFSHGQPSAENMNPQALRYAIQYVRGQQAGVQAKYQAAQSFLNANNNSTVNYPQFEAQWNRVYSPDVMMVRSMPNQVDQQAYMQQLKQQGKLNDFIKSYQAMQQMGAF